MPTLTCPHCQSPQAISDDIYQKNYGKKCRCRQCQGIFVIEAQSPPPETELPATGDFDWLNDDAPTSPPPPPPPKPKAVMKTAAPAPPAPVVAPPPQPVVDGPDFSSLLGGHESPTPETSFPDFSQPEPTAAASFVEPPDFPSFDATETTAEALPPPPKKSPNKSSPSSSSDGEVTVGGIAKLPDRSSLKKLSVLVRWIAWVYLGLIGVGVLLGLVFVAKVPMTEAKITVIASGTVTILGLVASAVLWLILAELIPLCISVETRLHEISAQTKPPQT